MTAPKESLAEIMEALIDAEGLPEIIEAIIAICYKKAGILMATGDDTDLMQGMTWESNAKRIGKIELRK